MTTETPITPPTLPQDLAAEAALLASAIMSEDARTYALASMREEDFSAAPARLVFGAIRDLVGDRRRPDVVAIGSHLRARNTLNQVGGLAGLDRLTGAAPDVSNIDAYVAAVRACAKRRAVLAECRRIEAEALGSMPDVDGWASSAAESMARVADCSSGEQRVTGVEVADALLNRWQHPERAPRPLSTSIKDLDRLMRGLGPGQLIVVGAHSGVGKSAFVHNMVSHALLTQTQADKPVGVLLFSLEMTKDELAERIGCSLAHVDTRKLDPDFPRGDITTEEGNNLIASIRAMRVPHWVVDDRAEITMPQIRAKARREAAILERNGTPLRLIVIDYAQIVSPDRDSKRRDQNREQEVAAVGRAAKKLAAELHVAVVICAQLNQDAHKEARKPRGADLRESRGLLQDANKVILLWNTAAMVRTEAIANGARVWLDPDDFDLAEVIVDKHRGGRTGTVRVRFYPAYALFCDADEEDMDRVPRGPTSAGTQGRKSKPKRNPPAPNEVN